MIVFILSLFVGAINADQRVLLISDPSTTTIISPQGKKTSLEKWYTTSMPGRIGDQAQWLGIEGMDGWPDKYQATFTASFYTDCPSQSGTLILVADDVHIAYINGKPVGTGGGWNTTFTYKIELVCGVNNLTIVVINYVSSTAGALTFKIIQDTSDCYKCNPATFYNFDTCSC